MKCSSAPVLSIRISKQLREDSQRRNLKDEGLCPHSSPSARPVEFDGKRRRRVRRPENHDPFRLYAGVEIGLRFWNVEPERISVRVYLLRTLDNFCVMGEETNLVSGVVACGDVDAGCLFAKLYAVNCCREALIFACLSNL